MVNEFKSYPSNPSPKDFQKGEVKTLPTWEFFYTGTLWRLMRGSKKRSIHPVPKIMRSCY